MLNFDQRWREVFLISGLILFGINLPYWLAYRNAPPDVFAGVLVNPVDGISYLAKMRQGWRGEWLFTLPYTTPAGEGVFVYSYYLALGHVARWSGLGLETVYHLARNVGGVSLLLSTYAFLGPFFPKLIERRAAWLMFALGSGLGWTAVRFGVFTADLWVAEWIPFLSLFTNAHFALAAALMVWVAQWTFPGLMEKRTRWHWVGLVVAITVLAQIQPLALLTLGLVATSLVGWKALEQRRLDVEDVWVLLILGVFSLPWLVYDAWVMLTHPILSQWNAQNLTPSPPVWDALLSGGMPLLLALPGVWFAARRRSPLDRVALVWFGLGTLSLYAPLALQRRLSLGLWMPLSILAGLGFYQVFAPRLRARYHAVILIFLALFMLPSNLLIYVSTLSAGQRHDAAIFLTSDEAAAFNWLASNAPVGAVVLAAPDTGLFIPAYTDQRVIYGHPFETIDATAKQKTLEDFWAGRLSSATLLAQYPAQFLFYGPRERALGQPDLAEWRAVFSQGEVTLYAR